MRRYLFTPVTIIDLFNLLENLLNKFKDLPNILTYKRYILQSISSDINRYCCLYFQPKLHKDISIDCPLTYRPICSNTNYPLYYASKLIHILLWPIQCFYSSKNKPILKSSLELIDILNCTNVPITNNTKPFLLSADITTLYPKIPIDTALLYIKNILNCDETQHIINDTKLIKFILSLLELVLKNCYILVNNNIYLQIHGTAMGTPCAVVFANLFLEWHRRLVVIKYNSILDVKHILQSPIIDKRFIDDIFMVYLNRVSIVNYINSFNFILPDIQIVDHKISEVFVNFLDITVSIITLENNIKFDTALYSKPTNTHAYLVPFSNHKSNIFKNFISNEIIRTRILCSKDDEFIKYINIFYNNLLIRGYTTEYLQNLFFSEQFELIKSTRNSLIKSRLHKSNKPKSNPLTLISTHDNISHLLLNKLTLTPTSLVKQFDHANVFNTPIRTAYKNLHSIGRLLIKNK